MEIIQPKKRTKEKHRINWKTRIKMAVNIYLSIIILNVNVLNAPMKRYKVAVCIKKQELTVYCLWESHFKTKDTYKLKVRGWKKIFLGSFVCFCLFVFSRATPSAYGGSQARDPIRAVATDLRQSQSNTGSEPNLDLHHSSRQCRILNPLSEARDWNHSQPHGLVRFINHCAMTELL